VGRNRKSYKREKLIIPRVQLLICRILTEKDKSKSDKPHKFTIVNYGIFKLSLIQTNVRIFVRRCHMEIIYTKDLPEGVMIRIDNKLLVGTGADSDERLRPQEGN
jgi:hypothetical protein